MLQPLHLRPSTVQVDPGIGWQVPAPVLPATPQIPVQQSASLKQMSAVWPQKETVDGAAQVLVVMSQLPLQQSELPLQALPAVWQPVPSCAQLPLWQAAGPLQHGAPLALHACPSEMHCAEPHVPLTQSRLQQSLRVVHAPPVALHAGCAQRCVLGSQVFEQQSASDAQLKPPAVQTAPAALRSPPTLRSPPPPALISVPLLPLR